MPWGLVGAFAASFAYGTGTALQASAVRRTERSTRLDPRLLWRLARQLPYVAGLSLDLVGFLLSLAALRSLPLFVVQAVVASSLAVTAVLAMLFLDVPLRRGEWAALGVVGAGLAVLALSAGTQHPAHVALRGRAGFVAAVAFLAVLAIPAAATRRSGAAAGAWALGVMAGLAYGAGSIGARILSHPTSLRGLLVDPATYGMALAGLLALLLHAQAIQRGSVTVATAAVVATETLVPAAVGLLLLSDHSRHGGAALSALGFLLTVAGALALARYGEPVVSPAPAPASSSEAPQPPAPESTHH